MAIVAGADNDQIVIAVWLAVAQIFGARERRGHVHDYVDFVPLQRLHHVETILILFHFYFQFQSTGDFVKHVGSKTG